MQQIRHSQDPHHSPLPAGRNFSRLTVRTLLRPADLLASLTDPTLLALCRLRLLLRSFRSEEITFPAVRYDYSSNWASSTGRLSPAGLAASFAALHVVSSACAGSNDYAGPDNHSRLTRPPCCLPPTRQGVGILIWRFSKLNHPAHRCLRPTLRNTPRDVSRKTRGQDGVAFSFPVGLLHPLQHAGLSRRTTKNAQTAQLASSPLIFADW